MVSSILQYKKTFKKYSSFPRIACPGKVSGENQELSTLGIRKIINPYFCVFRQDQQDLHDLFLSFQMKLRKTNPPLAEMIRRLCANTCPACPVGPADRTGVEF